MKLLEHADEIRRLLLMALEEAEQTRDPSQRAFLQTVVVGAGPAGCELAGSLIELMQRAVQRDFKQLHLEDCRVVLGDPVDRVLPTMPPVLSEAAAAYLRAAGVDRRLGLKVEGIAPGRLSLSGAAGEIQLEAATICWTAGVRASRLGLLLASHTGCPEPRSPAPPRAGLLSSGPSRDPGGG